VFLGFQLGDACAIGDPNGRSTEDVTQSLTISQILLGTGAVLVVPQQLERRAPRRDSPRPGASMLRDGRATG
jgi:hypothetical protein